MGIRTGLCRHVRRALRTARYGTDVELLAGRTTVGRAEPGPPPAGRPQSGGVLEGLGYSPLWCQRWDSNPHGALTPTVFEFPLEPSHPEPAIPESRCHVRDFSSGSSWPTTSRELRQRPTWPHNGHSVGAGITASRQPEMQILLPRHEHRHGPSTITNPSRHPSPSGGHLPGRPGPADGWSERCSWPVGSRLACEMLATELTRTGRPLREGGGPGWRRWALATTAWPRMSPAPSSSEGRPVRCR